MSENKPLLSELPIITRGIDKDGQLAPPPAPEGFETWWTAMESVALNGLAELSEAFGKSKKDFKEYATNQKRSAWAELKRKASTVKVPR